MWGAVIWPNIVAWCNNIMKNGAEHSLIMTLWVVQMFIHDSFIMKIVWSRYDEKWSEREPFFHRWLWGGGWFGIESEIFWQQKTSKLRLRGHTETEVQNREPMSKKFQQKIFNLRYILNLEHTWYKLDESQTLGFVKWNFQLKFYGT